MSERRVRGVFMKGDESKGFCIYLIHILTRDWAIIEYGSRYTSD